MPTYEQHRARVEAELAPIPALIAQLRAQVTKVEARLAEAAADGHPPSRFPTPELRMVGVHVKGASGTAFFDEWDRVLRRDGWIR